MVLCSLGFLMLLIPIAIGVNETVPKVESIHNTTSSAPKNLLQKEDNSTRKVIILPVEGGSILVTPPNTPLLKGNDGVLSKLPSDEFGEVSSSSKNKGHVVGRTGAPVIPELKEFSTKTPIVVHKSTIVTKLTNTTTSTTTTTTTTSTTTTTTTTTTLPPLSSIKPPHKPTVLKYEEPSNIVADKLSQPGISDGTSNQAIKPGSHPGMIMPIVITILVVPLFAVLGYMALKRGQEAWKNRHYKRMDFLLDGMYND